MHNLNTLASSQFTEARAVGSITDLTTGDYTSEATIDLRLSTADSTYYSAARLATMSLNDKIFALRTVSDRQGFAALPAPYADFTHVATLLSVAFTNKSTNVDGTAMTYSWNYGDGSAANTTTSPTKVYGAAGTYIVTLTTTVTATGRKSQTSKSITVVAS